MRSGYNVVEPIGISTLLFVEIPTVGHWCLSSLEGVVSASGDGGCQL